jgi:isopentenyl phosphate kinase
MILLKLGGSAITKKQGYMQADLSSIAVLASAVAQAQKRGISELIIVHGAGSFGHAPVIKYKLNEGVKTAAQKKGCKITQKACARLSSFVIAALKKKGVAAVSIPPHEIISSKNKRIEKFDQSRIKSALKGGKVPVLYGDMVSDSKLGCSVCSGDQIISYLGARAERIVLATNVDGVLVSGKVTPLITRKNFKTVARHITGSSSPDVTGGMLGKINELLKVKSPCYIVNAKKPARVVALLCGKKAVSTKVIS